MNNPVFQGDDLNWYFYDDEDQAQGPFEDEEQAEQAYVRYLSTQ